MIRMVKSLSVIIITKSPVLILVPPIGAADDIEEFSDVEDQTNDNDLR